MRNETTTEATDGVVLMVFNHYKVIIRNLTWALAASVLLIFLSNLAWLLFFNQYDFVSYSQDGEGVNNITTGDGSVLNGADSFDFAQEKSQKGEWPTGTQTN